MLSETALGHLLQNLHAAQLKSFGAALTCFPQGKFQKNLRSYNKNKYWVDSDLPIMPHTKHKWMLLEIGTVLITQSNH